MKHLFFFSFLFVANILSAQLTISNGITLGISGNAVVTVSGMDVNNQGTIAAGPASTLRVQGVATQNLRTNGSSIQNLVVEQTQLNLLDNCTVLGNINFPMAGGRVFLGNNDLVVGPSGTVTGYGPDAFIVTDNAGEMAKQNLSAAAFTFPVGNSTSTYNPLTLAENGTADEISVRCLAGPLTNGASGAAISADMAQVAWDVNEANAGGSNLAATAQWNFSDELSGFNRTDCGIARFNTGTDWDLPPASMGFAGGADPYTRMRTSITPGVFAVADEAFMNRVQVSPRIMLTGPYSATNNTMNDSLRIKPDFPLSAPTIYGTGKFTHAGRQPANAGIINPAILSVTGANAIVDWVFLWFKDPANPATNLQTIVALLQRDGDIVDLDGVSPVVIPGNAQNYILGVGHRNHLSVRSPNGSGLTFSETSATSYDFTTAQSKAFGTNPMRQIDTTPLTFGLHAGNANPTIVANSGNITVKYNGSSNDRTAVLSIVGIATPNAIATGYRNEDLNLDWQVKYNGSNNDRNVILSTVGITTPNAIITEQF